MGFLIINVNNMFFQALKPSDVCSTMAQAKQGDEIVDNFVVMCLFIHDVKK
jgi:hypothetical protein